MASPANTADPEGSSGTSNGHDILHNETVPVRTHQPRSEEEYTSVRAVEQSLDQDRLEVPADNTTGAQDDNEETSVENDGAADNIVLGAPRGIGGRFINGNINHRVNCWANVVLQLLAAVMAHYSLDQYLGKLQGVCEAIKHLRNLLEDMSNPNGRPVSPLLFLQVFAKTDSARSQYDGSNTGYFQSFWEALLGAFDVKNHVDGAHYLPDLFRMTVDWYAYCRGCKSRSYSGRTSPVAWHIDLPYGDSPIDLLDLLRYAGREHPMTLVKCGNCQEPMIRPMRFLSMADNLVIFIKRHLTLTIINTRPIILCHTFWACDKKFQLQAVIKVDWSYRHVVSYVKGAESQSTPRWYCVNDDIVNGVSEDRIGDGSGYVIEGLMFHAVDASTEDEIMRARGAHYRSAPGSGIARNV